MSIDQAFSLLLPVWAGDRVDFLRQAFQSAVLDQSLRPAEVVIVQDGPVPEDTSRYLDEVRATSPVPVKVVTIEANGGLGPALNRGLAECTYEIVARMDADDIAMQHRFEAQLPFMRDADIVGAGLLEFAADTGAIVGRRIPPTGTDIARYARVHDPFNHPTVIYRRSAVQAAGGYGELNLMEDYLLFARMLDNGATAVNLVEPLVFYRVGPDAYKRRGGTHLLRSELSLQATLHADGLTTTAQYLRNVTVRGGYRLIPWRLRRSLYRAATAMYRHRLSEPQFVSSVLTTPLSAFDRAEPRPHDAGSPRWDALLS